MSASARRRAAEILGRLQQRLNQQVSLYSLAPNRKHPTPLDALAATLLGDDTDTRLAIAFAQGLGRIANAQTEHFPNNVFADFDFLAATLLACARQSDHPATALTEHCDLIVGLNADFGCNSPIRFSYAHDFLYGFDWAKWVRQDPKTRRQTGPFDRPFLRHLKKRAQQIKTLIAANDPEYPALPADTQRNPFGFSRSSADEAHLHRALARSGHIPLAAWSTDGPRRWTEDFQQIRRQRAKALGMALPP